jgi:two-component system NtrC family sensor kinase
MIQLESVRWATLPAFVVLGASEATIAFVYLRRAERNFATLLLGFSFLAAALQHGVLAVVPGLSPCFYLSSVLALTTLVGLISHWVIVASEQKYRVVFEAIEDAILLVDLWSLNVLEANDAARRLTKRSNGDLVGAHFTELCPSLLKVGDPKAEPHRRLAKVFRPHSQFSIVRGDDSVLMCEGEMGQVEWNGRPVLQIRIREIAKKEQVGQLVRRADKMAALGKLVAGVAHELNNPLAVVLARVQILAKRVDGHTQQELMKILHESERAAKIVSELLCYARPSDPQPGAVNINRLIENVLDLRSGELEAVQIRLQKQLAPDLPVTSADEFQIEQVLVNVINNAIQALVSHDGPRKLTVFTDDNGRFIRIIVSDTGPGIPAEIIDRIFDPFFTTKPPGKGTGLGLSISNTIVEAHHGRLYVQSTPGAGASFHIELPVVGCIVEPPKPKKQPRKLQTGSPRVSRVLVADDEEGIREVLKISLEGIGYKVDVAEDGLKALALIADQRYDLILSDLRMPQLGGEELFEKIRTTNPDLANRIVFVTGDTVSDESRRFLEGTGNRWISKPFRIDQVEDLVAGLA